MTKKVKMKSTAPSPRFVPTVGEVPVDGVFEVDEEYAKELENGQFERVTTKTKPKGEK